MINTKSPFLIFNLAFNSLISASVTTLAILPVTSSSNFKYAKPVAFFVLTKSVNLSISFLENNPVAFSATIAFIIPDSSITFLNTVNSVFLNISVISSISIPYLKSGLSVPYLSIASK